MCIRDRVGVAPGGSGRARLPGVRAVLPSRTRGAYRRRFGPEQTQRTDQAGARVEGAARGRREVSGRRSRPLRQAHSASRTEGEEVMSKRRRLPPGAKWVTLPSGARRVEIVTDAGMNPATGKRRQVRRRFESEAEATKAYARMSSDVSAGVFTTRSTKTVEVVCRDWLAGRRVRPSTLANYADVLKPVRAAHGAMPVQRIEKAHVDALVTSLAAGGLSMSNGRPRRPWSPRSLNLMLTVLQMVLEDAMRQGWVVRNVAHLVDRVPQVKHEMETFTESDVRKVLKAAESDRLEAAWHLALGGLRRGEVCGLTWADVDLEAGELRVRHTRILVDGVVIESTPKTAKGERALPLPDSLTRVLKRARKRQNEDRLRPVSYTHLRAH